MRFEERGRPACEWQSWELAGEPLALLWWWSFRKSQNILCTGIKFYFRCFRALEILGDSLLRAAT